MELHELRMHETEFGLIMLGMKNQILIEANDILTEGDLLRLIETGFKTEKKTGRYLVFRIKEIDRTLGRIEGKVIWTLLLKRIVNYNEKLKLELKKAGVQDQV